MKLNSYILPKAFEKTTIEKLEECFREINNVVSTTMLIEVSFQYNSGLLMSVQMDDGNCLANGIYSLPMQDKQLQKRVIPRLLSMFPDISKDFDNIKQMNEFYNCDLNSFWGIHFTLNSSYCLHSKEECSKYIFESLWNKMSASTFNWLYLILLPHIIVADSALGQIESMGNSNNFGIVIEDLKKLNDFCETWTSGSFSLNDLKQKYAIDTTDESDTTKKKEKLKAYRKFNLKNLGYQYCFLHIKHGDYRLHYFPDDNKREIHIGYVGKHLPI